jgi:hypothetical protein
MKNIEGTKAVKCEVLTVSHEGGVTRGKCKRTVNGPKGENVTNFTITVRSDGTFKEEVIQFSLPLEVGKSPYLPGHPAKGKPQYLICSPTRPSFSPLVGF